MDRPVLHLPRILNLVYPFVPLSEEEEKTGQAEEWRFKGRLETVAMLDHPALRELCVIAEKIYCHGGRWSDYGYFVKEELNAPKVWAVMQAMLKSPFPNHIQRQATLALALYNWFGKATTEEMQEFQRLRAISSQS